MELSSKDTLNMLLKPLYVFIRRHVANQEIAEKLLEEVFLQIHRHLQTLKGKKRLDARIYEIVRNLVIDQSRRKKQQALLEEVKDFLSSDESTEEDVQTELALAVSAMINALPASYREALIPVELQGLSQRELARRLGLSFSGAKSRVQQARKKLRQLFLESSLVADRETAEDLLQEVFLKIHTHLETPKGKERLEARISQITRNKYGRKTLQIPTEEREKLLPADETSEEDVRAELASAVLAMIHELPEIHRETLVLVDQQGLSQKELAEWLELSFSGAKSRVQRAREKLRQLFLEYCHIALDLLGSAIAYQCHCDCCSKGTCPPQATAGGFPNEQV